MCYLPQTALININILKKSLVAQGFFFIERGFLWTFSHIDYYYIP